MQNNAIDLVQRYLDIEIAKSEFQRIQFFIVALLVGLGIMSFNFFLVEHSTDFFNNPNTKFLVVGWFVAFINYEIVGLLIAKRFLRKK